MKKLVLLILLVILFRFPMAQWDAASEGEKRAFANMVVTVFTTAIEPNCQKADITIYDGDDGFAYVGAECVDIEVDPDKIVGRR